MTKTKQSPEQDVLVTELLALVDTGATKRALENSPKLRAIAEHHADVANANSFRQWLARQADTVHTPSLERDRGRDYAQAISYALGLVQGTATWTKQERINRAAESLKMLPPSLTQAKPAGSKLAKLMGSFAVVLQSIEGDDTASDERPGLAQLSGTTADGMFYTTPGLAYSAAIAEIKAVSGSPGVTVDMASLRSSFDMRTGRTESVRPPHSEQLHDALLAHVEAGGHVRRIVNITSTDVLAIECEHQEKLRARSDPAYYELRAFVIDALPGFAPIVVRGRAAFLGLSDPASIGVVGARGFRSPTGIEFCSRAFEALWNEERAKWLTTTGRGISADAVSTLEQEIEELGRRRDVDRSFR